MTKTAIKAWQQHAPAWRDERIKWRETMPIELVEHMSQGYGIMETATALGVAVQTLYDWTDKASPRYKQEMAQALRYGEQLYRTWWLNQGRSLRDRDFNTSLWVFNAKNRLGWRDTVDFTSDGAPIQFTNSVPRPN